MPSGVGVQIPSSAPKAKRADIDGWASSVPGPSRGSGSSSAVEHLLAKEGVASSNLVFRSSSQLGARL